MNGITIHTNQHLTFVPKDKILTIEAYTQQKSTNLFYALIDITTVSNTTHNVYTSNCFDNETDANNNAFLHYNTLVKQLYG